MTGPAPRIDAGLAAELLPTLRAFAIPMPTRFRGVTLREGALLQGPAGWGEFSPFAEYGPRECARWLSCALEAAVYGWPAPVRDSVPVNVTVVPGHPSFGLTEVRCHADAAWAVPTHRSRLSAAAINTRLSILPLPCLAS